MRSSPPPPIHHPILHHTPKPQQQPQLQLQHPSHKSPTITNPNQIPPIPPQPAANPAEPQTPTHNNKLEKSRTNPQKMEDRDWQQYSARQDEVRKQELGTIQKEYQSVIRGYEIKIRNCNEEYRRCKVEMETKIKELYGEKIYWYNIAHTLMEREKESRYLSDGDTSSEHGTRSNSSIRTTDYHQPVTPTHQKNMAPVHKNEQILQNELQKLRTKIEQMEGMNESACQQKFDIIKQIERRRAENNALKIRLAEYMKQVQALKEDNQRLVDAKRKVEVQAGRKLAEEKRKFQEHIDKLENTARVHRITLSASSSQKKPQSLPKPQSSPPPPPSTPQILHRSHQHPSFHEVQSLKQTTQKYKSLVAALTQQIVQGKLKKLNQKYEKNYGGSYGAVTVSRGGVYPVNVINDLGPRSRRGSQVQ